MPSIVLNCPNCRQPYQMSPELITKYAGRTITCRKCKKPFAFDAAMDAAAQAAGQTEPEEEAPVAATGPGDGTEAGAATRGEAEGAYGVGEGFAGMSAAPATAPPPPQRRPSPMAPQPAPVYAPQVPQPPPPQAYAPPAYAPASEPPAAYSPNADSVGGIGDIFGFRRMALPAILPLVFWTGVIYCLYNGIRLLLGFVLVAGFHNATVSYRNPAQAKPPLFIFDGLIDRILSISGGYAIIDALFWIILGPLFWRGFCELILAASRLLAVSERK